MNGRRRRVTYRPNKGESIFSGVVGVVFVLIGLFVIIPSFGPFGIFWTACAAGVTGLNLYRAFGSKYVGPEIRIEDEDGGDLSGPSAAPRPSPEERLKQLEDLREKRLITANEFEEKRKEILKEL